MSNNFQDRASVPQWPPYLYETGERYGNDTFFFDRDEAQKVAAELNEMDRTYHLADYEDSDYLPITVDEDCDEYDLHVIEDGGTAIYTRIAVTMADGRKQVQASHVRVREEGLVLVDRPDTEEVEEAIELGAQVVS